MGVATDRDEVFSLLSNRRRRYALHACEAGQDALDVSELAEKVAAWEYGKDPDALSSDERKRVYTAMKQSHLPAMEDAGVVDYDGRTVSLTERGEDIEVYMEVVSGDSIPWSKYYVGLSLISALVVVAAWSGIYPDLSGLVWAALIVVVFGVSSAYHAHRSCKNRLGATEEPPEV